MRLINCLSILFGFLTVQIEHEHSSARENSKPFMGKFSNLRAGVGVILSEADVKKRLAVDF